MHEITQSINHFLFILRYITFSDISERLNKIKAITTQRLASKTQESFSHRLNTQCVPIVRV